MDDMEKTIIVLTKFTFYLFVCLVSYFITVAIVLYFNLDTYPIAYVILLAISLVSITVIRFYKNRVYNYIQNKTGIVLIWKE
jgi:hypothetical protein